MADLFHRPSHPYTERLLGSILRVDRAAKLDTSRAIAFASIDYDNPGCRFANRCPFVEARCRNEPPPLAKVGSGHLSRCWKAPLEALVA